VTALTLPQLKLEMDLTGTGPGTAPTYTDYSAYLRVSDGVQWQRGRQDERSDVTAGTASFAVNNDAGTFTGKKLRAPVRLSIRFDDTASYTVMWTGFVTSWRRGWTSGVRPVMQVQAADAVMLLEKQTLPPMIRGEILADAPAAYWPLDDAAGSTAATDRRGVTGAPSLAVTQVGSGGALDFGAAAVTSADGDAAAAFTPASDSAGKYLSSPRIDGVDPITLEAWMRTSGIPATTPRIVLAATGDAAYNTDDLVIQVNTTTGYAAARFYDASGLTTYTATASVNVCDGTWHHLVAVITGGTLYLYVDGVATSTAAAGWESTPLWVSVGGATGQLFDGAVAHAAVYTSALSSTRIASHYAAGVGTGERTDLRFDRIGALSDVTVATPQTGSATMGAQPTAGKSVWTALTDVAFAEQGTAYIAADGTPTLAVRSDRYGQAAAMTFLARDIAADTGFTLDDAYLVNDVTVSRPNGATARRVNTASQAAYGTRSDTFDVYYDTDAQVEYLAEWLSNSRATPFERIGSLTIDASAKAATVTNSTLAALDVSDLIRITISATNYDLVVEGLQDRVDVGGWVRAMNVSPNYLSQVWLLEDATYGLLDTTTVLGF